jgi:hypothetical protein
MWCPRGSGRFRCCVRSGLARGDGPLGADLGAGGLVLPDAAVAGAGQPRARLAGVR